MTKQEQLTQALVRINEGRDKATAEAIDWELAEHLANALEAEEAADEAEGWARYLEVA